MATTCEQIMPRAAQAMESPDMTDSLAVQPPSSQSDGAVLASTRLPRPKECRWCGARSMFSRYWTISIFPCPDCVNSNNAKIFSSKALPVAHLARRMPADVAANVATFFVPWHNKQALHQRQYLHLITASKFDTLFFGPIDYRYVPEPEDPMDIILDMLFPPVQTITQKEMQDMPSATLCRRSPTVGERLQRIP